MEEDPRQAAVERLKRDISEGFEYNGQPLGPQSAFEALPLPTYLKRPKPPHEELLGPLIAKGQRMVLGAATGEGKSTIIWWMVKALATGGRFLNWKATRPCRVLIVDAEQSDHDIERLAVETHLGEVDNVWLLHVPDGLSLNTAAEERARLDTILREGGFDVVILDPLYKLHTGDPNDEREAVALMKLFDRWRTELNFALIIPSHMRKPQGKQKEKDFSMHDIFGASAYLRGAEIVIGVRLVSEGLSRLYFFKSRAPGLPVRTSWALRYNRHQGFAIYETPTERVNRETEESKRRLVELLEEAGGAGVELQILIEETGRSRSVVHTMLKEANAISIPVPGTRKRAWVLSGTVPDQQDMEIMADDDDDE